MQQEALVRTLLPDGKAELVCRRASACPGECSQCGGCAGAQQWASVAAVNLIGAKVGDWVIVETSSAAVLRAAALVYLAPLALLLLGYFWGGGWGAFGGFAAGMGAAVWLGRDWSRKKKMRYTITAFCKGLLNADTKGDNDVD